MPLTKAIATQLINGGGYLGKPPKFDINNIVIYRLADFDELGFYPEPADWFINQQFKVTDMRQTLLGFPVMDIAWEYEVAPVPSNLLTSRNRRTFLEPQIVSAI
jgi:hypothetical protein